MCKNPSIHDLTFVTIERDQDFTKRLYVYLSLWSLISFSTFLQVYKPIPLTKCGIRLQKRGMYLHTLISTIRPHIS